MWKQYSKSKMEQIKTLIAELFCRHNFMDDKRTYWVDFWIVSFPHLIDKLCCYNIIKHRTQQMYFSSCWTYSILFELYSNLTFFLFHHSMISKSDKKNNILKGYIQEKIMTCRGRRYFATDSFDKNYDQILLTIYKREWLILVTELYKLSQPCTTSHNVGANVCNLYILWQSF